MSQGAPMPRGWCKICRADRAVENVRRWTGQDFRIGECGTCQNTIVLPDPKKPKGSVGVPR